MVTNTIMLLETTCNLQKRKQIPGKKQLTSWKKNLSKQIKDFPLKKIVNYVKWAWNKHEIYNLCNLVSSHGPSHIQSFGMWLIPFWDNDDSIADATNDGKVSWKID